MPAFPKLAADAEADVCVVGAGLAGMTAAYLLTKKGKRVVVIDDGPVGGGMTARTTAHLTNAIDDRYEEVERLHGEECSRLVAASHSAAIEAIEAIVSHEAIDCDFTRLDGYLFIPHDGDPDELVREYGAGLRAGIEGLEWATRAPIEDFDTGRCLRYPRQGQFHPLKYLAGLARAIEAGGGRIHCGVHAAEIEDGRGVRTREGRRIACRDIVVATNVPVNDRLAIHTKQAPYMTYVIAARVPRGSVATFLAWDTLDPYHYVRTDKAGGEILIVGGEDHKTGQADDAERRFANLELWMRSRFPMAREILQRWSGQIMETHDYLAFAGRNPGDAHTYVITGDSGMGMTHGTIGAIVVTDCGELDSVDEIRAGTGAVVRRGLRKIAAYRDPAGELHEMSARCAHLGCPVSWNHAEGTWDCKCHGSRYDAFGHVINGPANRDLEPLDHEDDDSAVRVARQRDENRPTPP